MAYWPEPGPSAPPSLPPRIRKRAPIKADATWSRNRKYALLVDAGSSGSRLQVYSWKNPEVTRRDRLHKGMKLKVLPAVEKGTQEGSGSEWQWKVEPGISSFGSHPQDIANYLRPLFRHALDIIPLDQIASTPVYIMATAGVRLLPEYQQQQVVQAVCSFINKETSFNLQGRCEDHVQVISGEEEGLLGWIAINYLMDGFHFKADEDAKTFNSGTKASKGKATYGFLDMGGASTQIAFEPSKHALAASQASELQHEEDLTQVKLKLLDGTEVTHDVFVTTFLGFGANKARERYEDALTNQATAKGTQGMDVISDPCLPTGSTSNSLRNTTIQGSGSFDRCLTSLAPLLDKDAPCSHPPCLFHGIHVPTIDFSVNHFIGVSEYWFSSHDIFNLGGVYDFVQFQKAAQAFCARPWSELEKSLAGKHEFGPQVNEDRLRMQCFKAAWMVTVLHDGIGIPRLIDHKGQGDGKDHVDQVGIKAGQKNLGNEENDDWFQSVNEVEGTSVSWTLGKAVLEATKDVKSVLTPDGPHSSGSTIGLSGDRIASHAKAAAANPLALLLVGILLFFFAAFIITRGRSLQAKRRRSWLLLFLPLPFGTCFGLATRRSGKGDYVLAEMEDGEEVMEEGGVGLSDTSSSSSSRGEAVSPLRRTTGPGSSSKGRGVSTGPLLRFLPLTARRWLLRSATYIPGTAASRRGSSRRSRKNRSRYENIYQQDDIDMVEDLHLQSLYGREAVPGNANGGHAQNFTPSLIRASRPATPSMTSLAAGGIASANGVAVGSGGILSRPASRASGRGSPRSTMGSTSSGTGASIGAANGGAFSLRPYGSPPPLMMMTSANGNLSRSSSPPHAAVGSYSYPLSGPSHSFSGAASSVVTGPSGFNSDGIGLGFGGGAGAGGSTVQAWTTGTSSSVSGSSTPVYSGNGGGGGGGSLTAPALILPLSLPSQGDEKREKTG